MPLSWCDLIWFIALFQDPHVEVYNMDNIESKLNMNREKLVAMALFLGCDYLPKGVPGVGKEQVTKLVQFLPHNALSE